MSFRCQHCGEQRPSDQNPEEYSPRRVVTKTRSYADRPGSQIVEEQNLCIRCALAAQPTYEVIKPQKTAA